MKRDQQIILCKQHIRKQILLLENLQRSDLNPIEEAEGYRNLLDGFHYTQEKVASIAGGTPPYNEDWNGADPNVLAAGIYTVDVTDANGCLSNATVNITEPMPLVTGCSIVDITCYGDDDGSVTVFPSGGTTTSWTIVV